MPLPAPRLPGAPPTPLGRRRPRGVKVTTAALFDPPTSLDESHEILRHPEAFRFLRERLPQSSFFSDATKRA
jgi:hypothetical protein